MICHLFKCNQRHGDTQNLPKMPHCYCQCVTFSFHFGAVDFVCFKNCNCLFYYTLLIASAIIGSILVKSRNRVCVPSLQRGLMHLVHYHNCVIPPISQCTECIVTECNTLSSDSINSGCMKMFKTNFSHSYRTQLTLSNQTSLSSILYLSKQLPKERQLCT